VPVGYLILFGLTFAMPGVISLFLDQKACQE
jgi:hypothetical protein